jgi:hypothetical protein
MHRLRTGIPLSGAAAFAAYRGLFDFVRLSAYQAEDTVFRADALLEDVCGMIEARDADSALFTARELVAAAVDAFLHHHGSTEPVRKWRCRQLAQLDANHPANAELAREFWKLQFPDAQQMRQSWPALQSYLEQCIRFANRTIAQVQQ